MKHCIFFHLIFYTWYFFLIFYTKICCFHCFHKPNTSQNETTKPKTVIICMKHWWYQDEVSSESRLVMYPVSTTYQAYSAFRSHLEYSCDTHFAPQGVATTRKQDNVCYKQLLSNCGVSVIVKKSQNILLKVQTYISG